MATIIKKAPLKCASCVTALSTNFCPRCRKCKLHHGCECKRCGLCQVHKPPKDFCPRCGRCKADHAEGSAFADDFPLRACTFIAPWAPAGASPRGPFIINTLRRSLGVELEISDLKALAKARWDMVSPLLSWHLEHDGSVRPSGQEMVIAPASGDGYLKGMAQLLRSIQQHHCTVNDSCGFHVHVDAADLGWWELRRVMVGFLAIAPQLWGTLVSAEREKNQYCPAPPLTPAEVQALLRLHSTDEIKAWFHKYLYNVTLDPEAPLATRREIAAQLRDIKSRKYMNSARRQAINFHSWMMRGTIEFRLKEGSVDPVDILFWPLWCGWFVEAVQGLTDKEVENWYHRPPSLKELTAAMMPKPLQVWVAAKLEEQKTNA